MEFIIPQGVLGRVSMLNTLALLAGQALIGAHCAEWISPPYSPMPNYRRAWHIGGSYFSLLIVLNEKGAMGCKRDMGTLLLGVFH